MKRLFYSAGIVLSLSIFSSCAQHDTTSPDTSGSQPNNQPGVGVDTVGTGSPNTMDTLDPANERSNSNQQINTGDSSRKN